MKKKLLAIFVYFILSNSSALIEVDITRGNLDPSNRSFSFACRY